MSDRAAGFQVIRDHGGVKAVVEFSGGNDEGYVEGISILDEDDAVVHEITYGDAGEDVLAQPVWDQYHGFAGEFYVSGRVVWDAEAGTVKEHSSYGEMEYHDQEREVLS